MDIPKSVSVMPPRVAEPFVSVLVPICNVERYLDQCLSSLLAQTFTNFEVICINDGSEDGSREIIQKYLDADTRFRVIDKPNSGYGASMNLGLDSAIGTYIGILESDDMFDSEALELLVSVAERESSDVVKANFWLYWSVPEERRELFRVVDDLQAGHTLRPLDDIAVFFRKPSIWSALYRRDFLKSNNIRFLETPGASYQDSGFCFKVWASAFQVSFIADPILLYRQDNEKSSVNNSGKTFCVCDEYKSMKDFLLKSGLKSGNRLFGILERMKLDSYLWNFNRLADNSREEFVLRASREFSQDFSEGLIDLRLFEPGARVDLEQLVNDPGAFVKDRSALANRRGLNALLRYLRLGGPPLVFKVFWFKFFENSPRRTNEWGAAL